MKIILDYFLYGMERDLTGSEKELIDNLLASTKYLNLLEDLVRFHREGEENPRKFVTTNVKTFDSITSYTLWRRENNRSLDQGLEGLNTSTIEMFKQKYFKMILSQYKNGQMIPYIE